MSTLNGRFAWVSALVFTLAACGARSGLGVDPGSGQGGASSSASGHAATSSSGSGGNSLPCVDGEVSACGSNIGACKPGTQVCHQGVFGPCEGAVGPSPELCNGIDDNCDGNIDEGFHLGEACDGPDTDLCFDDVMTCQGCSTGPNNVETCNGVDDNCNGIVDADCEVGDCQPSLLVVDSTPSSPSCVDFPVMAGSMGVIEYPCGGGPVKAQLGDISVSGAVSNGFVSLDGTAIIPPSKSPDGCTWQTNHHIEGTISSGTLTYSYSEMFISGTGCWSPCTETGTVQVTWQ